MAIQIRSFNQILGDMIRKIISDTPLNDLNAGSVLLTLLEAAASNDFENNAAILNVLELLNIDAIKNNDLDARAGDFGLTRQTAIKASGLVKITNTNITKRSTGLYAIKPAPIAGQTKLFVINTAGWSTTGKLYIGRDTDSFEGPIDYTITGVYPTYTELTLSSALKKDHLISDIVIDSQGEPDRLISAGTIVKIPANNQNPEIQYVTLRNATIPSGEDSVSGVEVIALVAGSQGNASINTITSFDSLPFIGAAVTNITAFSNGKDIETDVQLRNRIKSYSTTLARGTAPSIISAIIGLSDADDSKQVASAVLTEPIKTGAPSIMYIDDGYGFEPSYAGQSIDSLLRSATGTEEFFQLANYPIPRPQVINSEIGPFSIVDGSFLRVIVDGEEETIYFSASQFLNISAATLAEVIIAINSQSILFKARFTNNSSNILLYPVAYDAETIQVAEIKSTDNPTYYINYVLKFPTNEFSYIALYQNSTRLREKAKNAELVTTSFAKWNVTSQSNIIISVDGTPAQDRTFALSDFSGASSFSTLTLEQWVAAFNSKFAGLMAEATPSQTMIIRSNRSGAESSILVSGGDLVNKWFSDLPIESHGQTAQFELNRQTGNLRILTKISSGDSISAGVQDAKGFSVTTATISGTYNFSADDSGRPAEAVIVIDSTYCNKLSTPFVVGSMISIQNPSTSTMRIMSDSLDSFANLQPNDFIYIPKRSSGWLNDNNTGLFKIKAKGYHTSVGVDTFIDVDNINVIVESGIPVADILDIKCFETDGYPQVWRGSYLANPPSTSINDLIASLTKDLVGVFATVYKSNSIKVTSTTENYGSIAIPVAIGNASTVFSETASAQFGNPSHIAARISDKSLMSYFKRTEPTNSNVFLDRCTYTDRRAFLTSNSMPDAAPFSGAYSELIESVGSLTDQNVSFDDYISFTDGNNRKQIRSIKAKIAGDIVGTQQGLARTEINHTVGDELELVRPLSISSDDSIVVIMDRDSAVKTIDVKMSRTGRVRSGAVTPNTTQFSAYDEDNEAGVNFDNTNVWGKSVNGTDFSDYAVWMRARNWYSTGGISGSGGKMLIRSSQYGPNGEQLRFSIEYPQTPNQSASTSYINTPSWSKYSYIFGSSVKRAVAINQNDTISVTGPYPDTTTNFPNGTVSSGNYYDYTFSATVNLSSVVIGDILSINSGSGISAYNAGQFKVANKQNFTVRVFNPNASVTSPGSAETTTITTIADTVGTPTSYNIATVADIAGSLHLKYFIVYDSQGSVAIWYDVDNTGALPPPHGANRAIKIATVTTGDSASIVATKTGQIVELDNAFTVNAISNNLYITNKINGPLSSSTAGTSGFTVSTTIGIADSTLDGKYFLLHDSIGTVAVWYDVNNDGTLEPFHGADRSIRVSGVRSGDDATTVAAATVAALNPDLSFTASNLLNVITVYNAFDGNTVDASSETSGFTISVASGSLSSAEIITSPSNIVFFPLTGTAISDIRDTVNAENIIEITVVGSDALTIDTSTNEEDYSYVDNTTALAYGHNPTISSLRSYISLHDGVNWVKDFQNTEPNFTMKRPFTLNNVAPSIYQMDTAPNYGTANLGELFKLIPVTVNNIYHQLTQKALSQLPIVSNVKISNDRKNVQISSKNLGSSGAIEIIGGNANKAKTYIIGESEISTDFSGNHLLTKIPSYPDTFNVGDYVKITNDTGARRLSRLSSSDSITVTNPSGQIINYTYNPKNTNITPTTKFSIADISASYARPAGFMWRWYHDGSATLAQVKAGDQVMAFGPTLSWDQGNKVRIAGDGAVAGLPIIYVNDAANYFDIVNPYGKTMPVTFTVTAANAIVGAVYTVNGMNFIVLSTISGATTLQVSGPIPSISSGTLTLVSGTGDATISFSNFSASTLGIGLTFTANTNFGTFMPADVNTSTNTINFVNSLIENQTVSFNTTSALPSGISVGTTYYAVNVTGSSFQLSTVPNGSVIALGTIGNGVHTLSTETLTNVSSISGLFVGQQVIGTGIASGSVITSIGANTVKLSKNLVAAGTGVTISAPNVLQICPTPIIKWNLAHAARTKITSIERNSNTVTVLCSNAHILNTGDYVSISDTYYLNGYSGDLQFGPIIVTGPSTFTFVSAGSDFSESPSKGSVIKDGFVPTKYKVEKLNINNFIRLSRKSGQSPRFTDCGVAVDDYIYINGSTFKTNNNGMFRVLAADNDSVILENSSASEEINLLRKFNNKDLLMTWSANTNVVTGSAGAFSNLNIGDWVKKVEDPDSYYRQIVSFSPSSPYTATSITLGSNYIGSSAIADGVAYDQLNDHNRGVELQNIDDIVVLEGDSAIVGDTLHVQNLINSNWFNINNIGTFGIIEVGTDATTYKPFVRILNSSGVAETNRLMSVDTSGFYIVESLTNKFSTVRQLQHVALDDLNRDRRSLFMTPANRAYKFSSSNNTSIEHMGKLGYNTDVVTGIDGYLYYTGLLRRAQRVVDGYEPDQQNFPGRRAVGGSIEILPPLIRKINVSVDVTTNDGVNLGEIANNIKSVIISYVQTLGVGDDVILSEIIAAIMQIKGVAAVTFTNPIPSTERITIASNEKATIDPESIGIS